MDLDALLKRHKAKSGKKKKSSSVANDPPVPPQALEVTSNVDVSVADETGALVESSSLVPVSREKRTCPSAPETSKSKKRKIAIAVGPSVSDKKGLFLEGVATLREFPIPGFDPVDLQGLAFPAKKRCLPEQGYVKRLDPVTLSTNFDRIIQWVS